MEMRDRELGRMRSPDYMWAFNNMIYITGIAREEELGFPPEILKAQFESIDDI